MPRVIVYMTFGSHLYGTNTPQSDEDYRGVMLPDAEAVLCCRAPRTKNSSTKSGNEVRNGPDDVDTEVYALHYFLDEEESDGANCTNLIPTKEGSEP